MPLGLSFFPFFSSEQQANRWSRICWKLKRMSTSPWLVLLPKSLSRLWLRSPNRVSNPRYTHSKFPYMDFTKGETTDKPKAWTLPFRAGRGSLRGPVVVTPDSPVRPSWTKSPGRHILAAPPTATRDTTLCAAHCECEGKLESENLFENNMTFPAYSRSFPLSLLDRRTGKVSRCLISWRSIQGSPLCAGLTSPCRWGSTLLMVFCSTWSADNTADLWCRWVSQEAMWCFCCTEGKGRLPCAARRNATTAAGTR